MNRPDNAEIRRDDDIGAAHRPQPAPLPPPRDPEGCRDYDIPCVMHEPMEFDMAADLNPGGVLPPPVKVNPRGNQEQRSLDCGAGSGGE